VEPIILDSIPFQVDLETLKKKLHVREGSPYWGDLLRLAEEARDIAKPKAVYRMAFIDEKGEEDVLVEGVRFQSRILRVNLGEAQRVFPFVATCGTEMEEWTDRMGDMLRKFWAETLKEIAVQSASRFVEEDLVERYRPGKISRMSPGSLADWPIQQQRPLFQILGDTAQKIGVRLTESLLMLPTKTVSGIRFPKEESFESCQLCPREICPNRRAPYDKGLYERKYK
jgi:hypothetical protein